MTKAWRCVRRRPAYGRPASGKLPSCGRGSGKRSDTRVPLAGALSTATRAAEKLGEAPDERETETHAAEGTRGRAFDLAEVLEDHGLLIGAHADTGVGDRDLDTRWADGGRKADLSARRELGRVGQQVHQGLAELAAVGVDRGEARVDVPGEAHRLVVEHASDPGLDLLEELARATRWPARSAVSPATTDEYSSRLLTAQVRVTAFDRMRAFISARSAARRLRDRVDDLGVAEDGVQRGPELVRDVGEHLGLEAAGFARAPRARDRGRGGRRRRGSRRPQARPGHTPSAPEPLTACKREEAGGGGRDGEQLNRGRWRGDVASRRYA